MKKVELKPFLKTELLKKYLSEKLESGEWVDFDIYSINSKGEYLIKFEEGKKPKKK